MVTSSVLLNNSSIPETRGTVNGIGFAFGSLLSAVGCVSAATVFAWSQNNGITMFNIQCMIIYSSSHECQVKVIGH